MKMRRRLAKKIQDHHSRYSRGRWLKAMVRLGWKLEAISIFDSILARKTWKEIV